MTRSMRWLSPARICDTVPGWPRAADRRHSRMGGQVRRRRILRLGADAIVEIFQGAAGPEIVLETVGLAGAGGAGGSPFR